MKKYLLAVTIHLLALFIVVGCGSKQTKPEESKPPVTQEVPDNGITLVDIDFHPDLQEGDSGKWVETLQQMLGITADGKFGPQTKQRVIQFQMEKGLQLQYPGTVGKKTWAALYGAPSPVTPQEPASPGDTVEVPSTGAVPALAWDNVAERKEWSKLVVGLVGGELWPKFKNMRDGDRLCPKFNSLTKDQKVEAISEMIVAISYFESGWSPVSRMYETTMGYHSEGLLQLSYPDVGWAKYCKFDKTADSKYPAADSRRTILNPLINLDCGIRIMADQVEEQKRLILSRGVYWSVIKEGGKYQKISQIASRTQAAAPFCK